MASSTHIEGCCSLFRIFHSITCPHKLSIQHNYELALHETTSFLLATILRKYLLKQLASSSHL